LFAFAALCVAEKVSVVALGLAWGFSPTKKASKYKGL
jgi:hypothetical protein